MLETTYYRIPHQCSLAKESGKFPYVSSQWKPKLKWLVLVGK